MKINIKPAYICMPLYCSIAHSPPLVPSLCACPVTHGYTLMLAISICVSLEHLGCRQGDYRTIQNYEK
jgi:hypothetical protein